MAKLDFKNRIVWIGLCEQVADDDLVEQIEENIENGSPSEFGHNVGDENIIDHKDILQSISAMNVGDLWTVVDIDDGCRPLYRGDVLTVDTAPYPFFFLSLQIIDRDEFDEVLGAAQRAFMEMMDTEKVVEEEENFLETGDDLASRMWRAGRKVGRSEAQAQIEELRQALTRYAGRAADAMACLTSVDLDGIEESEEIIQAFNLMQEIINEDGERRAKESNNA